MSSQAPSPPGTRPDLRVTGQDSPQARYQALGYRAKRVMLGPPLRTAQLVNERISKRIALAVFSSVPISSTAYATEEMLLVLVLAGTAGVGLALPLAGGIALLLLILVVSYRQVIRAYPRGGGAYMVSRDNLGPLFASICGAALLIDYVLTVAVSVSAGTAALASAVEPIGNWRVELSVAFIVLLMWGNLRGIREAGKIFAVPTYLYIRSLGGVVLDGIWRVAFGHVGPISYDPASSVGLVGPEGGVVTFRKPEARNAQRTLLVMALIMAFLFLGITFLARQLEVQPYGSGNPTLVAQIARYVLGPGIGRGIFVFVQVATLAILVLAANTAFNGFPVLAYFAADDALLPRQLR